MRRLLTLGLTFLLVGGPCLQRARCEGRNADAWQTSASSQEVEQTLDRYIQAMGGKDALQVLRTRRMTGRVSSAAARVAGRVQVDQKAPNKWLEKDFFVYPDPPPKDHSERQMAFNGVAGWSGGQNWWSPPGQIDDMDAGTSDERNLAFDLGHPLRLRELYVGLKPAGLQQVESDHSRQQYRAGSDSRDDLMGALDRAANGRAPLTQAYVIEATKKNGSTDKLYFDLRTGLLLRYDLGVAPGRNGLTWYFEDYRDVGGVKVPYRLVYRQNFSGTLVDTVFAFQEVYHNISIDDTEFERPRGRS